MHAAAEPAGTGVVERGRVAWRAPADVGRREKGTPLRLDPGLVARDVVPLWMARYDYEPGWTLPVHRHADHFQVILIVSGTGQVVVGREVLGFSGGELLFVAPGVAHGLRADARAKVRTLDVKFAIRRPSLTRACRGLVPLRRPADPRIGPLLEGMLTEARTRAGSAADLCGLMLQQLLLLLLQSGNDVASAATGTVAPESNDPDLCSRLERYLRENCGAAIDQAGLSEAMHYSYRHLYAVWRQRHAMAPLQAVWHYRVDRAGELMRFSDHALKRIAEMTGFASIHHFTRVFARIMGVTPARWRARERVGARQGIVLREGFVNAPLTIERSHEEQRRCSSAGKCNRASS